MRKQQKGLIGKGGAGWLRLHQCDIIFIGLDLDSAGIAGDTGGTGDGKSHDGDLSARASRDDCRGVGHVKSPYSDNSRRY